MANLADLTRKQQILVYLQDRKNEWVDGTKLATEEVGGSEGLRRLRDLRGDGYFIEQRRHPDPGRDIWQYRLIDKPEVSPLRDGQHALRLTPHGVQDPVADERSISANAKLVFGVNKICSYCEGKGTRHSQRCEGCEGKGWI